MAYGSNVISISKFNFWTSGGAREFELETPNLVWLLFTVSSINVPNFTTFPQSVLWAAIHFWQKKKKKWRRRKSEEEAAAEAAEEEEEEEAAEEEEEEEEEEEAEAEAEGQQAIGASAPSVLVP